LSFEAVFGAFRKTREHLEKQQRKSPYRFVTTRLERAHDLSQAWLDIYELYGRGYQSELTTFSKPFIVRTLSIFGTSLEKRFGNIFQAKIPPEVYVLLSCLFGELGYDTDYYVVAEGDCFEQKSIYGEIYNQSLKNLSPPRKIAPENYTKLLNSIQDRDTATLYYERSQYDNALSWPLLLHECLHWLYSNEKLNAIELKIADSPNWIKEVLIDIYVSNFFGPVYATSLVSYLSRYPHEETFSHPHFIVRLYTCYRYLVDLSTSKLQPQLQNEVSEAVKYVQDFQGQYQDELDEVKPTVDQIYNQTRLPIIKQISQKTKTFEAFVEALEADKHAAKYLSPTEHTRKEVLLTSDVQQYYDLGIPVAAHPRVLFNSFIARKYLQEGVSMLFIQESLKRYCVKQKWLTI
jgi:hypothetical protein